MKLIVTNSRLKSVLRNEKSIQREFGKQMTDKITLRLDSLQVAESLGDFWPPYSKPERCHELKGDLAGYFSIDLKHPYRLLIKPSESKLKVETIKEKDRWNEIKEITIEKILDTHD